MLALNLIIHLLTVSSVTYFNNLGLLYSATPDVQELPQIRHKQNKNVLSLPDTEQDHR